MKLNEISEKLNLKVISVPEKLNKEVTGGYTSDLLSDVIANARKSNIWITMQTHLNIVAVARLKELAGIILVNDRQPEELTLKKAEEEEIPLLCTTLPAFEVSGRIYALIKAKGK